MSGYGIRLDELDLESCRIEGNVIETPRQFYGHHAWVDRNPCRCGAPHPGPWEWANRGQTEEYPGPLVCPIFEAQKQEQEERRREDRRDTLVLRWMMLLGFLVAVGILLAGWRS